MKSDQSLKALIEKQKYSKWGSKWGSLSYHAYVSSLYKYFYIGTPKVGCTKVKLMLHQLEGYFPHKNRTHIHNRDIEGQPFVSKLTDFSIDEGIQILGSSDWFRFCFIRNPYDRLFSAYKSKIMNDDPQYLKLREKIRDLFNYPHLKENQLGRISFRDFVRYIYEIRNISKDFHWATQTRVLLFDSISYDFIGRFETFQQDLSIVLDRLKTPDNLLNEISKKVNATARLYLAAVYDKEIADIAYDIYRSDFDAFEYDRNSWMYI